MNWSVISKTDLQRIAGNTALFLTIPIIGLFDGMGGDQIRLTAFFLIPIMSITWRMGRRPGYFATAIALAILLFVSYLEKPAGSNALFFAVDAIGRFISFFIIVAILSNLRNAYLRQKSMATRDPLTNLYNRLGLREILNVELENARRDRHSFAVFFLDCDNFKEVNDSWGHHVGDQLLQTVARTILASIRRSDIASRLGGDEFVVYAGRLGDKGAAHLIDSVKANLDSAMRERQWPVTFSIGAAIFESAPSTFDELIRFADALMYETKKTGKNGLRIAKWKQ